MILSALAAGMLALGAPEQGFVEAATPSGVLKGTLLSAGRDAPVAVIIPGSGPVDRDGDSPAGLKAGSYRLLAEALAARGVSTIRIDKRASFASGGAPFPEAGPTFGVYAADAKLWAAEARRRTGARCAWLVGHSEGALVALAAAQDATDVCGLVLVAAAGRPITAVIREQLKANPANAPILDEALTALGEIEAGRRVDAGKLNPALMGLFNPPAQTLLIDGARQDPVVLLRNTKLPVLVVQGTTDLQVGVEDARLLAGARPGVELVLVEGVNHVLKQAPNDMAGNFATYADPSLPVAPEIADAVAGFIKAPPR
jgi:hypothetical protein